MGDMWILFIVGWRLISRMLRYLGRGALLVPVAAMGMALFGFRPWTLAALVLAVIVAVWRPALATVLLPVTMVVAGISGLVAAATEPGANFWTVTALSVLKRRLVRRPPNVVKQVIDKIRRPPVIVRQVIVNGHARTVRLGPPGVPRTS